MYAKCVISDSGTISEESSILGFAAVTLRNSMERPESLDSGTIVLTGFDSNVILKSIEVAIDERKINIIKRIPIEYQIEDTSWRVLKIITGAAKLSNIWDNIASKSI